MIRVVQETRQAQITGQAYVRRALRAAEVKSSLRGIEEILRVELLKYAYIFRKRCFEEPYL